MSRIGRVRDAVETEQVGDVALLETDPAQFHPADLGLGRADRIAGVLAAQPLGLTQGT
jgi:hypothetical protein